MENEKETNKKLISVKIKKKNKFQYSFIKTLSHTPPQKKILISYMVDDNYGTH